MEVILADYLGFCYGVKRAIAIAQSNAAPDGKSSTLGPIIHNPQMVDKLRTEGVGTINTLEEMPRGGRVIIRSHGVGPETYDKAEQLGLELVDATCPHVKRAQLAAKELRDEGRRVIIIGEKNHPEVQSVFEWSGCQATIIENEAEADALDACKRLGVVCQTTFSTKKFSSIINHLLDKGGDIRIVRTICTATEQRQSAARELAGNVDVMIVIGGRNSANTTRLAQVCAEKCKTYHIETAEELQPEWLKNIEKIGITAGASTPDWIIKEVYNKCQKK